MRNIKTEVKILKQKYNTNDPFEICHMLGIWVYVMPLGKIEGHYTYAKRKKVFFINEDLTDIKKSLCCAHELGHALLHTKSNVYFNSSNTFFIQSKLENQANEFAAELCIDDNLLKEYEGYSLNKVSECTGIDKKYLELKFKK